jgi:hypothetical protein
VYVVDPYGLETSPITSGGDWRKLLIRPAGVSKGEPIFDSIAPATGGKVFRGLNDVSLLMDKSIRDGSSYYTRGLLSRES